MRESIRARMENQIRAFLPELPTIVARALADHLVNNFVFHGDEEEDWYDLISLPGNVFLRTHTETVCEGQVCCVHNPSDHHMASWDQFWDARFGIMMRVCDHDIVHPDPDDLVVRTRDWANMPSHSCDGCCSPDGTVTVI